MATLLVGGYCPTEAASGPTSSEVNALVAETRKSCEVAKPLTQASPTESMSSPLGIMNGGSPTGTGAAVKKSDTAALGVTRKT